VSNKKLTYILLVLAATIWGIIIYRIVSGINGENGEKNIKITEKEFYEFAIDSSQNERYALKPLKRDPFLSAKTHKPTGSNKKKNNQQKKKQTVSAPPKPIVFPEICFMGIIKNRQKQIRNAMIKINGKDFIAEKNEIYAEIMIDDIYTDSITVKYRHTKKTIHKGCH